MPNRPAPIKQAELVRIAKAMQQAGIEEWRVEIRPGGTVALFVGRGMGATETPNPCDVLLEKVEG